MASLTVVSASARVRLEAAAAFVAGCPAATEVVVVGATRDAADDFCRGVAVARGATFGLHRFTLGQLASRLATATLAARGVTPATALAADALATRALFELTRDGLLGYLAPIADSPGLPRSLAETLGELREAGVAPERLRTLDAAGPDLAALGARYTALLEEGGLADRAALLGTATALLRDGDASSILTPGPLVLLDVPLSTAAERDFVAALVARASAALATVPAGDLRTIALLPPPLATAISSPDDTAGNPGDSALARVRRYLFAPIAPSGDADDGVQFFSAPGEAREAVEVARRILDEAARGVAFDEMALVVRAPDAYWGPIEQALERARVPAWFSRGTPAPPDPTGRAFLALLACAAENLSARSFAEYLSLGQGRGGTRRAAPDPEPPPLVVSIDDALVRGQLSLLSMLDTPAEPSPRGWAPRATPRLGPRPSAPTCARRGAGSRCWSTPSRRGRRRRRALARRLDGLRASWRCGSARRHRMSPTPQAAAIERDIEALDNLAASRCRSSTSWRRCRPGALGCLARSAARRSRRARCAHPARVLELLADLRPMAAVGPVTLAEVRQVLLPRCRARSRAAAARYGRVFVATPTRFADARSGRSSPPVSPSGSSRSAPRRIRCCSTRARGRSNPRSTEDDRVAPSGCCFASRSARRADRCCCRIRGSTWRQSRPRVPSFYALDVVRATRRDGARP